MNILALDTTSRHSSIAVLQDQETVLEYNFCASDSLSAVLIPSIEFVLDSLKIPFADIDLFAAATGPGLYTGIRIGLATLKGLLLGHPRPFVPVLTLHALACKYSDSRRTIVTLVDARRGEVCLAAYRFEESRMVELIAPQLTPIASVPERVGVLPDPVFVGSGAETHRLELKQTFPESSLQFRSHFLATEIGRIAGERHGRGASLSDPEQIEPFYLRPADAEAAANAGSSRERAN